MIVLTAADHFDNLRHCQCQRAARKKRFGLFRAARQRAITALGALPPWTLESARRGPVPEDR
jgi:hypothetical protein